MPMVEERVSELEALMAQLVRAQMRTDAQIAQLSQEMGEFKDEMSEFKDEMSEFKDEMSDFKDEMSEFKNRMTKFSEEVEADRKRMNKAWGELANKMGTIVEDIVAPNISRLAEEEFGFSDITEFTIRGRRKSRRGAGREREFDVVCAGPDRVIVAESKTSPTADSLARFDAVLAEFFDFYPEYEDRQLIGIIASMSLTPDVRANISDLGWYGIAMADDTMEIVARPAAA